MIAVDPVWNGARMGVSELENIKGLVMIEEPIIVHQLQKRKLSDLLRICRKKYRQERVPFLMLKVLAL